ncbi:AbrB family transcriptional regulator [Rhodoferax sp.]|uniref:AbrB family transcriptional regulator n=1 Tax=Rhodoferax sp. TaxID=50421 RepID=UPI00283BE86A|nr:AbrB family transcriptional regulator [Rhodoferax sp.]MDR3367852.1 AbrB family transcriptional regulator [Rhodoferax sp.]
MFVSLFRAKPALWWGVLLPVSATLSGILAALHLPAVVLLGCMFAGILLSSNNVSLKVPPVYFALAQGVLGCLMAHSLQPAALAKVAVDWPIFLLATSSIIAASAVLGWIMMRRQLFPGTTAVWGLAPGAASAMVLMAEDYGADVRLVAIMQYLRVAVVTAVAALVAGIWAPHVASVALGGVSWLAVSNPGNVALTVLLAVVGALIARRLRIPAGSMVAPLVVGSALQATGYLVIELPPVLLMVAYAFIGWSIGLRFTRAILLYALRALPMVLGSIFALMGVGILIAVVLSHLTGLDPLSAYLSTSPGGADSVAVIAATSAVDTGFVMAMQLARFLMVLVLGPQVSKFVATRAV